MMDFLKNKLLAALEGSFWAVEDFMLHFQRKAAAPETCSSREIADTQQ